MNSDMRRTRRGLTKRSLTNVPFLIQNECFGQTLRNARLAAGWSRKRLAEAIGVSHRDLLEIEDGERAPLSFDQILGVTQILGCDARPLTDAALLGNKSALVTEEKS